jgi:uncharacterized protein
MQLDGDRTYLYRHLQASLEVALADTPVVCLLGPRQCGKSTLAQQQGTGRQYLTLDDATLLAYARNDPKGFVTNLPDRVTIDEVQRAPEVLLAIKHRVDQARRPGRYLLTGSANLLQLPKLADSLAGRMECLYLQPLTEAEKSRADGQFLSKWLNGELQIRLAESGPDSFSEIPGRLIAGGYPEACQRDPSRARMWLRQYVKSIIERDVQDVAQVKDSADLDRLLTLLAHRTGSLVNVSELANLTGATRQTVENHCAILEKLFLVRRLPAWHRNASKRLVKTPKIHLCDSGLAAMLTDLTTDKWMTEREKFGHLLESFVVQQLIAQAGWTDPDLRFWHYRDKDQVEVDCVLTRGNKVWGVEVKLSRTLHPADAKGLRRLAEICGNDFQGGILFYDGTSIVPITGTPFLAVPLSLLWTL